MFGLIKKHRICHRISTTLFVLSLTLPVTACGGDSGDGGTLPPTDIAFGDTALVVVVNPAINDGNDANLPAPGQTRADVLVSSDDGLSATTDASGIAVLAPLTAGARTITLSGANVDSSFVVTMTDGELREVAVAADGTQADIMVNIDYKTDQVTEITPAMDNAAVNAALAVSDTVVFFTGGVYQGDIDFSGSRVTLFGEGALGGEVVLEGNITVSGSDSRIRGTEITGDLIIPASGVGLSFSRVDGSAVAEGSDGMLLSNQLCGATSVTGSGIVVLGNLGVAPEAACP